MKSLLGLLSRVKNKEDALDLCFWPADSFSLKYRFCLRLFRDAKLPSHWRNLGVMCWVIINAQVYQSIFL